MNSWFLKFTAIVNATIGFIGGFLLLSLLSEKREAIYILSMVLCFINSFASLAFLIFIQKVETHINDKFLHENHTPKSDDSDNDNR